MVSLPCGWNNKNSGNLGTHFENPMAKRKNSDHTPKKIELPDFSDAEATYFIPLAGSNEIGMNFNLYGYKDNWLIVDCGVAFGGINQPGITAKLADPVFLRGRNIVGLVVTHAHEDHIGAVAWLWPQLRCPVYVTPFSHAILRKKLQEFEWGDEVDIREQALSSRFSVSPFEVELATITHSIPEPNALIIHTPVGPIFHTGDWKFDPSPQIGAVSDIDRLRALAGENCLALVGDSTNSREAGHSASEATVVDALEAHARDCTGRVVVTSFASNVARIQTVAEVAKRLGRRVQLVGRSMEHMASVSQQCGYLNTDEEFISSKAARSLAPNKLLICCTGSQGEPAAALQKLARGQHPIARIERGDRVIFSSRRIPGNEIAISDLQNRLIRHGIEVVEATGENNLHVSGHPQQDELRQMFEHVRPKTAIPVHGEARHLKAHADLARSCQVPYVVEVQNGDVVRLTQEEGVIVGRVPDQYSVIDNQRHLAPMDAPYLLDRKRLSHSGVVLVVVTFDDAGSLVCDVSVENIGLPDTAFDKQPLLDELHSVIDSLEDDQVLDDDFVRTEVFAVMRQNLRKLPWAPLYHCVVLRVAIDE